MESGNDRDVQEPEDGPAKPAAAEASSSGTSPSKSVAGPSNVGTHPAPSPAAKVALKKKTKAGKAAAKKSEDEPAEQCVTQPARDFVLLLPRHEVPNWTIKPEGASAQIIGEATDALGNRVDLVWFGPYRLGDSQAVGSQRRQVNLYYKVSD